jgi:hypothetical protein
MKKVDRSELLSLAAYEEIRPHFRARMIEVKTRRRMALGEHMTIIFENHDTMLLQVQEMLRTERISDEAAIAHELETYNELVPAPGYLSATLFIEYDDAAQRTSMLAKLATLRTAVQFVIGDSRVTGKFATHHGEEMDRLPAVNYLQFEVGSVKAAALKDASVPAWFEITHPDYPRTAHLPKELRIELARDLE